MLLYKSGQAMEKPGNVEKSIVKGKKRKVRYER
jgi:hypothetical protein